MTWLGRTGCVVGALALLTACSRDNPSFDEDSLGHGDSTGGSMTGEESSSGATDTTTSSTSTSTGDGDGDPSTSTTTGDGDGDGDPMSSTTTTTTTGDGDGDPMTTTTGDGDGDGGLGCAELELEACQADPTCKALHVDSYYADFNGMEVCFEGELFVGCIANEDCVIPDFDLWCNPNLLSIIAVYTCLPPFIGEDGYQPCPPQLELFEVPPCL